MGYSILWEARLYHYTKLSRCKLEQVGGVGTLKAITFVMTACGTLLSSPFHQYYHVVFGWDIKHRINIFYYVDIQQVSKLSKMEIVAAIYRRDKMMLHIDDRGLSNKDYYKERLHHEVYFVDDTMPLLLLRTLINSIFLQIKPLSESANFTIQYEEVRYLQQFPLRTARRRNYDIHFQVLK